MTNGLVAQFRVYISKSHGGIATSCLRTLMTTKYTIDGQNLYPCNDQDGSFAYAARFRIDHVVLATTTSSHLSDIIKQFLRSDQSVNRLKWRRQGATSLKMTSVANSTYGLYGMSDFGRASRKPCQFSRNCLYLYSCTIVISTVQTVRTVGYTEDDDQSTTCRCIQSQVMGRKALRQRRPSICGLNHGA